MRASNVGVIFRREVRDQLRDKRTLFMILLMPILLYPILGIGMVQLLAAFEQKPRTVVVVGAEHLPESPRLLNEARDGFNPKFFDTPADARRLVVRLAPPGVDWSDPEVRRRVLRSGQVDAVVLIPREIRKQLGEADPAPIPIAYDSSDERSQITYLRIDKVIDRWREEILRRRLERDRKPVGYVEPVRAVAEDVATRAESGGSVWAKLFPFLLVMMALTGAFYPAVDICAGEKERGTMETLLISPASRGEIVLGKFLTIMLASVATAVLNLASMGVTGYQLARQVSSLDPGPGTGHGLPPILAPPSLVSAF